MSDTRHLADLKFDERPFSHPSEGMRTDRVMLQKADVWISQFKTRLNIGIIALVVLWGAVSYFKSTSMQLAARTAPETEQILADGSADELTIATVEVDSLHREIPVETVEAVETENLVEVGEAEKLSPANTVNAAPAQVVKKHAVQKAARSQKKLKKSVASKPTP